MNNKKCLLVLMPLLLTACGTGKSSSEPNSSNSSEVSSISSEVSSSNDVTSSSSAASSSSQASSSKPETPYSYQAPVVELPTDVKDIHLGLALNLTHYNPFDVTDDSLLMGNVVFDRNWQREQSEARQLEYFSSTHKPVTLIESKAFTYNSLFNYTDTGIHFNNTNFYAPSINLRHSLKMEMSFDNNEGNSDLVYYYKATANYYSLSLGDYATRRSEFANHLDSYFMSDVNEVCASNNPKDIYKLFDSYGTHILWAGNYGTASSCRYYAESPTHDLASYRSVGKTYIDNAISAGLYSKTYEEYERRVGFSLEKLVKENKPSDNCYVFESIDRRSVAGPTSSFLSKPLYDGIFAQEAATIASLINETPSKTQLVQFSKIYAIWEFLPDSMQDESDILRDSYQGYIDYQVEQSNKYLESTFGTQK